MGADISIQNMSSPKHGIQSCDITAKYSDSLKGANIQGDKVIAMIDEIVNKVGERNAKSLANKNIKEIISIISGVDMYIGNDSFGQHIACQIGKPSIILLLDTPSAYSEYSKNQHQILPEGASVKDISHDSSFDPNTIKVETVLNKALLYL